MDKSTLSQYGWVIICIIVIAILLGLATPFGSFVKDSVYNTTTSFGQKIADSLGFEPSDKPDDEDVEYGDDVDPDSQQARNLTRDTFESFRSAYIGEETENAITSIKFESNLGPFKDYDIIYPYSQVPEGTEFNGIIMDPVNNTNNIDIPFDPNDTVYAICLELYFAATEDGDTYESAESLFLAYFECSTKEELDLFVQEMAGYANADEWLLDEFGVNYDAFIAALDEVKTFLEGQPERKYMDEDEVEELARIAFAEGRVAFDITHYEANIGISDEKDAGRVITYMRGTEMVIAGKNGRVIAHPDIALTFFFRFLPNLKSIDFNNSLNTQYVTDLEYTFSSNSQLETINFKGADFSNVTSADCMLGSKVMTKVDLSDVNFQSLKTASSMFSGMTNLVEVIMPINGFPSLINTNNMFANCTSLGSEDGSLDLSWIPSTLVTASRMFDGCTSVTTVKGFDDKTFPDLTDAYRMLPPKTAYLSMKNFCAPNITSINSLPYFYLDSLVEIDISGMSLNTESLTAPNDKEGLAPYSRKTLEKVVANNLKMPNLNSLYALFSYCSALESVELSFTESKAITRISSMFSHCSTIKTIDLTNLDLSSVSNMSYAFYYCSSLETLKVGYIGSDANSSSDTFKSTPKIIVEYNDTVDSFNSSGLKGCLSSFNKVICTDGEVVYQP